jgi:phage terminase large subunit GpA-like protein
VDHIVIAGSPRERAPWDALADLLARDWPRANGGAIRIAKACVDTSERTKRRQSPSPRTDFLLDIGCTTVQFDPVF